MKKKLREKVVYIMAAGLCAAVVLCAGCGQTPDASTGASETKENAAEKEVSGTSGDTSDGVEETEQIGNPWTDTTLEEISKEFGNVLVVPAEAVNPSFSALKSENMVELRYEVSNDESRETYVRLKKADAFEDISGVYVDKWTAEDDCLIISAKGSCKRLIEEGQTCDLCLWYDQVKGIMYSVYVTAEDLDGFDVTAVANEVCGAYAEAGEGFIPACFVEERTGKDSFASFDELIAALQPGEGYAYLELTGAEGKVLGITENTYDNQDGKNNAVSIDISCYAEQDGVVRNIGNAYSSGTAYPIACEGGILYTAGNHEFGSYFVNSSSGGLMMKDCVSEVYDEEGNASYYGFLREVNDFDHDEEVEGEEGAQILQDLYKEMFEKKLVNFTVVK